jgi:hypothetical protein
MPDNRSSLDAQINDYLLIAAGQLSEGRAPLDTQRIAAFGAAASSALVMMTQAEAAVVHTAPGSAPAVDPAVSWARSTAGATDTAALDLNGDGDIDMRLYGFGGSVWYTSATTANYSSYAYYAGAGVVPNGANRFIGGTTNTWAYASKLAPNASIGPAGPWNGGSKGWVFYTSYWYGGNRIGSDGWSGGASETGLVGAEFKIGGNTHYGWIRLRFGPGAGELSATEWAYESCPDTPIAAGATSGGASCPTPVPTGGGAAYGLSALALGGLGLAGLRRRRGGRKARLTG